MNTRLEQIASDADLLADFTPSRVPGRYAGTIEVAAIEKFAKRLLTEMVNTMTVEGSDFYHNEANNYGCITTKFFVDGNPWTTMRGDEVQGRYADGVRGSGMYRLNDAFVEHLWKKMMNAPATQPVANANPSDDL